jgi:hypothetical protein
MSYDKSKGGRPLKLDPNTIDEKIEEYFKYAKDNNKHITITGLAWYLGIDRLTLLNYEKCKDIDWLKSVDDSVKDKFINSIKDAKRRIECEYEESLYNKNSSVGAIFTLKNNYGWVDKQEIEQTNKDIRVELTD